MKFFTLIPYYLVWHYTTGIVNYFGLWGDFIWFSYNYFSLKALVRTLFSPFKRLSTKEARGFSPGKFLGDLVVDILMRIIGFALRIVVIIIGLLVTAGVIVAGLVLLVVWAVLPWLLGFLIVAGVMAVIK
ncbi:MAG TPA: hypothetical protein P5328_02910 [Candidatus Paceibacterota bacterium]|nr:hypothetical protein [Candidatus Paceibacterota bacterium]HRZ34389.1 hypothetical protein [Candidatus Paceibacterota bacterium]